MRVQAYNDREYRTLRRFRCAACGYPALHYVASWDSQNAPEVFAVPYAGLNGGIGHEVGVPEEFPDVPEVNECEVYLSRCCDTPYMGAGPKAKLVFHSVFYRCRALDLDGAVRCRLNRHTSSTHLAPNETPDRRTIGRTWTMWVVGKSR